jgi:hypothetical protein
MKLAQAAKILIRVRKVRTPVQTIILICYTTFFSPSSDIPIQYLKSEYDRLHPTSFQFTTHYPALYGPETPRASLNKHKVTGCHCHV